MMATKPALHHVSGGGGGGIGVGDVSLFAEPALVFVPTNAEQTCGRAQRWHFLGGRSLDSAACIFMRLSTLCEALGSLNVVM